MCGIAGVFDLRGSRPLDRADLLRMRDTMRHRGPDDAGLFVGDGVALAHRRLSIIDVGGGHQPMSTADRTTWITYNGEVYNFLALRARLEAAGVSFRTKSDTEVVLEAYRAGGDAAVAELRGIFAFAIWDGRRRRLLLARDHVGVKPLYYTVHDGRLLFASEVRAILAWPGVRRAVDETTLWQYLGYRYVPGPRTMFEGISKLPPGHLLVASDAGVTLRQYWDLPLDAGVNDAATSDDLRARLEESVRLQLVSDVPVGVFLSGGVDSATVTGLMARETTAPVETFCIAYADSTTIDERPYARLVADRFGTTHRELTVGSGRLWTELPHAVWFLEEPIADKPAVSLLLLAEFARRSVTVALSGEGADEIQAGYGIYVQLLQLAKLGRWPWLAPAAGLVRRHRTARVLEALARGVDDAYCGVGSIFTTAERARLLGGTFTAGDDPAAVHFERTRSLSPLQRVLYFDTKVWLPDDLLLKADKMTMASSLELRVPFLDHTLVEWAWRLPAHLKIDRGRGKALLRAAVRDLVPAAVLERPKIGFTAGGSAGCSAALARRVRQLIVHDGAVDGVLDRREVERLVRRHEHGDEHLREPLFTLLTLAWWHRLWIDPASLVEPDHVDGRVAA
jgi:asparagine synthase (glutamine-hydrolysing)